MAESRASRHFSAIVGAPRCGTTSLANYLGLHPVVNFSVVKEPHFFSQHDLTAFDEEELIDTVEREYLARFFPQANGDGRMLMEGSVTYLYTPEQMKVILRVWPEAKFIIAVRDPFEMLPSLHQRLLFTGDETVKDFAHAWALAPERARGRHIPRTCVEPKWLQYPEIGRLGTYVERFFDAVGRERCHVVVFDDFAVDPAGAYQQVLSFLGLVDDGRTDFSPRRTSRSYRFGWLQRLLKRPPAMMRSVMAGEKFRLRFQPIENIGPDPWFVRRVFSWRERLLRWNEAPVFRTDLSVEIQAEIRTALIDDIVLLGRLIGRDLSQWLGGMPAAAQPPVEQQTAQFDV
jgi:hypothetical protein